MSISWEEYERARIAERDRCRAEVDAAWKEVQRLEAEGAALQELSPARTRLWHAEQRLERAEYAE